MYQSCCLGCSQQRQEGAISSSCACNKASVMFTNFLTEAKQNNSHHWGNCPTTNTYRRDSLPFPCLGYYSMWPTAPLTWGNPNSPSGCSATLPRDPAASSAQPHAAMRSLCPQAPLRNLSDIPATPRSGTSQGEYTVFLCLQPLGVRCGSRLSISGSAAAQYGWGGSVQVLIRGSLHPPSNSCKFYFKFMTSIWNAVFHINF